VGIPGFDYVEGGEADAFGAVFLVFLSTVKHL
jgi:hypothetical protein